MSAPNLLHVSEAATGAHDTETAWLIRASSRLLNNVLSSSQNANSVGEHINGLAQQVSLGEDSERLVNEASGIVAIVGLHHVLEGKLPARDILEAAPEIIISTVSDEPEAGDTYTTRLADVTEEFCLEAIKVNAQITTSSSKELFSQTDRSSLDKLAVRSKSGDVGATNAIIAKCAKKAQGFIWAHEYFLPGGEQEDLVQEALIGIVDAIKNFDPSRGNFLPLADLAIRRRVWAAIKGATRQKHTYLNQAAPLNGSPPRGDEGSSMQLEEVISDPRAAIEDQIIDKEFLQELQPKIHKLTEVEYLSLFLHIKGYTYQEIANRLDNDEKSVDNALQRARRKLASTPAES